MTIEQHRYLKFAVDVRTQGLDGDRQRAGTGTGQDWTGTGIVKEKM